MLMAYLEDLVYIFLKISELMEAKKNRRKVFNRANIKTGMELDAGQLGLSKRLGRL